MLQEFLRLLWGTVIYRPYVYGFFACFLVFSLHHMGWKRTFTFLVFTYLIAFVSEYSSTHYDFPFGPYTYIDETRTRELWIANVPFWDSLSFVFLSYFSFMLAVGILGKKLEDKWAPVLGGILMMLLDVVIDPLTLQGEKWFLGKIYFYPYEGFYFGVTLANFLGWLFVGWFSQVFLQKVILKLPWCQEPWRKLHPKFYAGVYGVYAGVFLFNLGMTFYIRDHKLAAASSGVVAVTLAWTARKLRRQKLL